MFGSNSLQKTEITLKTLAFFGCLGVIVLDLDAEGDKFVANSGPETAEKTEFVWTL